jgi:hypothetical protein
MRPDDAYEEIIAGIDSSISRSADRIDVSVDSVKRSMELLVKINGGHLSHEQHSVLRAFETLFAETMHRDAWMFHRAGDHLGAKHALEVARKMQDATEQALV